jgi:hypothetical protein
MLLSETTRFKVSYVSAEMDVSLRGTHNAFHVRLAHRETGARVVSKSLADDDKSVLRDSLSVCHAFSRLHRSPGVQQLLGIFTEDENQAAVVNKTRIMWKHPLSLHEKDCKQRHQ